jgi:hypothetical protein
VSVSAEHQDDHYGTLEVSPEAPIDEIHEAWRFKLLAYHPDRFRDADQRERAEEITKRVNAAWQVLGDPRARARYDRTRSARALGSSARMGSRNGHRPALPCPSCATLAPVPGGTQMMVDLRCPGCGERFRAMVNGRCLVRPWLERRWLGLKYAAVFGSEAGERQAISFRRLPKELALSEGELFSLVFHPRRGNPVYAVIHGERMDMAWKVA